MSDLQAKCLFSLEGRSAVITGAGAGLGRMLARGFAANGAIALTLVDLNLAGLEQTRDEIIDIIEHGRTQPKVTLIQGDLATEGGIQAVIDKIVSNGQTELDVLVHCAGIRRLSSVQYSLGQPISRLGESMRALKYSDMDASFRVNLFSQYFLTAGLIELLGAAAKHGGGRGNVICFSSVAAQHFGQFAPAYQLSKAGVDHMVRTMAAEFAEFYIRVNAISPGLFPSEMNPRDPKHPNYNNMAYERDMPARRAGTEQEMVGTALYLASAAGAYMTGENLRIDGGRLLVLSGKITEAS